MDRAELRAGLQALGFDVVRFARAEASGRGALDAWLAAGNHADMDWMVPTAAKRADPGLVLEGARSVIVLGVNYLPGDEAAADQTAWARYSLYTDYHDTIKAGLVRAGGLLERRLGIASTDYRYYVDTGPVAERGWASRAGIGFIGRNGMLISREFGNWLFLAVILVRAAIDADESLEERFPIAAAKSGGKGLLCGGCTRCLSACPTDAFPEPGLVDARRCISYHTIENRGMIPAAIRTGMGARIFGCDICLEVCPWNRFARAGRSILLECRPEIARLRLVELLRMTPDRHRQIFRGTAMKRLKLPNLLRNAAVVAGNVWGAEEAARPQVSAAFAEPGEKEAAAEALLDLASHESAIVRAHSVWALGRMLGGGPARERLEGRRIAESDPTVLAELADLSRRTSGT